MGTVCRWLTPLAMDRARGVPEPSKGNLLRQLAAAANIPRRPLHQSTLRQLAVAANIPRRALHLQTLPQVPQQTSNKCQSVRMRK